MEFITHWVARLIIGGIQLLPLKMVAWIGRCGGTIAWFLDARHRKVIIGNLQACLGEERSPDELRRIGRENMKRIGENYAAALKTSIMPLDQILRVCELQGLEKLPSFGDPDGPSNCIVAIGHFGNFELNAAIGSMVEGLRPATTYRGLKNPVINELILELRKHSGCLFFERRSEAAALKNALNQGGLLLGLLADQHGGSGGVWSPFLGRMCSTTPAPAVFALRYSAPLFTAICYRTALGRWKVEIGDEIPTRDPGGARSVAEITSDINRAFELAVRRDPENWFWVHKRWKEPGPRQRALASAELVKLQQVVLLEFCVQFAPGMDLSRVLL